MKSLYAVRFVRIVILGVLYGIVLSLPVHAQSAAISGTITDSTGAVVEGAQVTARNLATNVMRTATSSGTGAYSMTNLDVGTYEVMAKKEGFRTFRVPSLELTVAQVSTVNAVLMAGATTEEVTVNASTMAPID